MDEQHIQARLITLLRQDNIRLSLEPFTTDTGDSELRNLQELAVKYAPVTGFTVEEVMSSLEILRSDTSKKDEGNKEFKETSVASLELQLPGGGEKKKSKVHFKTKLDITTQELENRISEEFKFQHLNLILSGKKLSPEMRLDEQNVKNNSKIMVVNVTSDEEKSAMLEEEEKKRSQDVGVQRTQKGFQILSERDGSEDQATTPFLEIADQKGNPLQIPNEERKALILAMGFHEKGRSLMKKRDHSAALCHLLLADEQFNMCNSALLNTVDNYAVLQLDIMWCYQALKQRDCLNDARQRLSRAEECFQRCYGEKKSRLELIKGHTGGEDVLFLRLYLLQSVLAYHDGNKNQASKKLIEVERLFSQLRLDPDKITQLMSLGFSEQDARLGLRACRGDLSEAVLHITQRKKEKEEMEEMKDINTLVALSFSKRDAARALHQARGDVDKAYNILLDSADLLSPPSSSDNTASASSPVDEELVNEALEDIPRHEEDYLDLTLDEEQELMTFIRSCLDKQPSSSG
ncbi:hypothetical protein PO909_029282 [Leuciscus waleckii]